MTAASEEAVTACAARIARDRGCSCGGRNGCGCWNLAFALVDALHDDPSEATQHTCYGRGGRATCAPCMAIDGALWDAIHRYVIAAGGDPAAHVYGNTPRMQAVADVGAIIARLVSRLRIVALDNSPAPTEAGALKLRLDHEHLQRLYAESRDYVRALERERDALVEANQRSGAEENNLFAEGERLRACLIEVRGFLRGAAHRAELGPAAESLREEADAISSMIGELPA